MRLIDADKLLEENTWEWFDDWGNYTAAGQAIADAPTAYDVDKVVEDLAKPLCVIQEDVQRSCIECDCEIKCEEMKAVYDVLEIVRADGRDRKNNELKM